MEKLYEGNFLPLHAFISDGSIATRELNFTSIETIDLPPPSQNECVNLDNPPEVSENPFLTNPDGQRESHNTINLDEEEHMTSSCSRHKGASYGKKRKQSKIAGVLQEYVDFRKKQTSEFNDELDGKTKPKDDCSIKNCLAILESIEELSDDEKALATNIFKCELNREIFINFKNPNIRLLWIKGEIASKVALQNYLALIMACNVLLDNRHHIGDKAFCSSDECRYQKRVFDEAVDNLR
ncbi:hypothetical protein GUJ93_ZPchr0003g16573 [Zizania palustris]|uniref:Uncharacterized protein n=1 Tax=Zizania palustris TaxID=103762 RepID=A0A8J5VX01_ZIZPA|nr:hypothetical protein GUJ93_ZPchr0003g16573 [Zizania palustris]